MRRVEIAGQMDQMDQMDQMGRAVSDGETSASPSAIRGRWRDHACGVADEAVMRDRRMQTPLGVFPCGTKVT